MPDGTSNRNPEEIPSAEPLLSCQEVAKRLGVVPQTVRRRCPGIKVGLVWRYRWSDVLLHFSGANNAA